MTDTPEQQPAEQPAEQLAAAPKPKKKTLRDILLCDVAKAELAAASSGFLDGEHLANIMYLCVQKTPALKDASAPSIINACKTLAAMQCEPDGINGFLVPRKCKDPNDKNKDITIAVPIPSARGLMRMATNNGITNLHAGVVRKGEPFEWEYTGEKFRMHHEPGWDNSDWNLTKNSAEEAPLGYYVIWTDQKGYAHGTRMSHKEVLDIMKRSDAYAGVERAKANPKNKGWADKLTTPWHTDFVQMALKTVIKRAAKQWSLPLPIATALAEADAAEFTAPRPVRVAHGRVFTAAPAESATLPEPEEPITALDAVILQDNKDTAPIEA